MANYPVEWTCYVYTEEKKVTVMDNYYEYYYMPVVAKGDRTPPCPFWCLPKEHKYYPMLMCVVFAETINKADKQFCKMTGYKTTERNFSTIVTRI